MSKPPLKMYPTVGEFYENGENEYIKTFLPPHDNFEGRELRIDGVGRSTLKQNEAIVVLIQHHQQLMKKDKEKEKEKRKKDQIENQNLNESKSQLSNRKEQNFAEEKSKPLNSFDFSQTDSATTYNSLYSLPPPFPNHVHTNVGGLPPSDTGLYITLSGFLVMYSVLNFLSFLVPEPNETINKIFSSITTLSLLSAPLFFLIKKKLNLKKVLRLHKGTNDFKIALLSILLTCTLISNLYLISAFTKIISNNIPDFDENTDIKSFGLGLLSFVDVALIPGFCEDTTITDIIEQIKNNLDNKNHLLHYCIQLANLANDVEKRKAYAENGAIEVFILVLTNNLTNFKVIETILAGLINCSLYPQNIDYLVCSTDLIKLLGELFENLSDFQTRNFLRKKTKEKEKEKEEENEKDELGESKNVIVRSIGLFWNLSSRKKNISHILNSLAMFRFFDLIQKFSKNQEIQERAFGALLLLSCDSKSINTLIRCGLVPIIIEGILTFPNSKNILLRCVSILYNCSTLELTSKIINKTKVPHIMINILNTLVLEQGKKQGQEQESEEGKQIQNQYINLEILNSSDQLKILIKCVTFFYNLTVIPSLVLQENDSIIIQLLLKVVLFNITNKNLINLALKTLINLVQKKQYKPKFINHKIINLLIKIQRNQNNNSIISVYLFQIISFLIFEKNFINIVIDTEIWDLILNIIIENNTNDILTSTGLLCLGNLCSYKEFRSKFLAIDSFDYIITTISQKINNQTIIDNGSFFLVNATLEQEIKQYLSKQNNHIQMLKKLQQIYSNNKTISKRTEIILSRCK
ncbi:armadillo repeat-containing protein 4 armc4 [Anaeramoeba flamelloides]|uniref:Armadillo repeat-containing protein 4 armc4 n=1 Tax=Anaeramoeba flamelloides TaxID=1746091 RepID=A0AAV7ZYE5_9EUKA|nr:armadillo repeat-containing protein 4 armc4 [Anaeramoeba flamelloides]